MSVTMEEINITHFVNPHLFWFKIKNSETKKEEVNQLESKIKNLMAEYRKTTQEKYKHGDLLVLNYIPWDKYVRASVVEVFHSNKANKYIVWLIDHGFPVLSAGTDLSPLPSEFLCNIGNVQRGGIANILPIEKNRDLLNQRAVEWTERAFREMFSLMATSYKISIDMKSKMKKHVWCDLKIEFTNGQNCMASHFLQLHNLGEIVDSDEFQELCVNLKTLKQRPWEKYNRRSNYVKNERVNAQYEIALNEINKARKAAHHKVNDWLERNFPDVYGDCYTVTNYKSKTDNKPREVIVDELNNDMQDLLSPPLLYKPDYVIDKFSLKMPPMPDVEAFDMSEGKQVFKLTEENIKAKDNTLVAASKFDIKKDFTPPKLYKKSELLYASSLPTKNICFRKYPFALHEFDDKNDDYVSPFKEEDLQSTATKKEKKNFLPAGFDVSRLVTYRNPCHWHQAKSTHNILMKPNQEHKVLKQQSKEVKKIIKPSPQTQQVDGSVEKSKNTRCPLDLPQKQKQEQKWCELTSELTEVKLVGNINWSNFYVQVPGAENFRKYTKLMDYMYKQSHKFIPVHEANLMLGGNYIVKYDDLYYRAILQNAWKTDDMKVYSFFFVDNSFVYEVVGDDNFLDDIFLTARQIIDFVPFQAIHCTLVGLQAKSCEKIKFDMDPNAKLYAFACIMDKNQMENLNINSYKIALFACEDMMDDDKDTLNENGLPNSGILLNTAFKKTNLAECDKGTYFFLDSDFGLREKPMTKSLAHRLLLNQQT